MFKRRRKLKPHQRIRQWMWPRRGWKRAITYYWHRLHRIPGTAESIAAGFAIGVGCGFSPLLGTHALIAAAMAWAMGGSLIAAMIGTLSINPWTAPPVWFACYELGAWLLPEAPDSHVGLAEFAAMFGALTRSVIALDGALFERAVWPVLRPMLVGSIPLGLAAGFVAYFTLVPVLRRIHLRRANSRAGRTKGDE
jgi:uncharacterized protein (DUF2062 family)